MTDAGKITSKENFRDCFPGKEYIANVLPRCYLEKNPDQINRQKEREILLNFNMLKLSDKMRKRFESIAGELRKPYLAMILLTFKAVRGTTFEHTSKAPRTI